MVYNFDEYCYKLHTDGTEYGFYSHGACWDYSEPNGEGTKHVMYMVGRGEPELADDLYDHWEPVEYEMIYTRPRLKYPKR